MMMLSIVQTACLGVTEKIINATPDRTKTTKTDILLEVASPKPTRPPLDEKSIETIIPIPEKIQERLNKNMERISQSLTRLPAKTKEGIIIAMENTLRSTHLEDIFNKLKDLATALQKTEESYHLEDTTETKVRREAARIREFRAQEAEKHSEKLAASIRRDPIPSRPYETFSIGLIVSCRNKARIIELEKLKRNLERLGTEDLTIIRTELQEEIRCGIARDPMCIFANYHFEYIDRINEILETKTTHKRRKDLFDRE